MSKTEMAIGFVTDTPSRLINKTGTWRTLKPIIDHSKCTKCGWCYVYCPEPCISIENSKYIIDYEFCKGCGICAVECPMKCIEMVREEVEGAES